MMTMGEWEQALQASFNDTIPRGLAGSFLLEQIPDANHCGILECRRTGIWLNVYNAAEYGPNLASIKDPHELFFYVKAQMVWTRTITVRLIWLHKFFAIWDYEGKLESKHCSIKAYMRVLWLRLQSPPGKIVQGFGYKLLD